MTANYSLWFQQGIAILKRYGFDSLADGWNHELVNLLLKKDLNKVKDANTKEKTIAMFNDGLAIQSGVNGIHICDFISDTHDIDAIYLIFNQWRTALLSEA